MRMSKREKDELKDAIQLFWVIAVTMVTAIACTIAVLYFHG